MNAVGNSSFSKIVPNLQIAWDSTSLGTLKECPRKYFYTIILGRMPRAENVHLIFGLIYHKALEEYDHAKAKGASHQASVRAAVRRALQDTWLNGRPWDSGDSNKNRYTLVRTVIWYLDQFEDDPCETLILANGKPAVELSFRFEPGYTFTTGEHAIICGHMDRIVKFQEKIWVLDRKTTKHTINSDFFLKFNPDNQMTTYTLASKVVLETPAEGVIIDGVQIAVGFSRFLRGMTTRHPTELEEWSQETKFYIQLAEGFARAGFWPKNDKSCGNYGGCPFRGICSKAPSMREKWMDAAFHHRIWDPLQIRGDI